MLYISVDRCVGDRSGADFVARVDLPSGETIRAIGRSVPQAIGILFASNREWFSDPESELRHLIDSAITMGIPGLTAFGDGLVHRLPWTERLLVEFDWPDFSVRSEASPPLTSERAYARRPLAEVLREQAQL